MEKTFRHRVLAYSLSGLVHYHHSGEHGGRRGAGEVGVLEPQSPSDTLPLTPVSPSKPVKEFHSLEAKHSNEPMEASPNQTIAPIILQYPDSKQHLMMPACATDVNCAARDREVFATLTLGP